MNKSHKKLEKYQNKGQIKSLRTDNSEGLNIGKVQPQAVPVEQVVLGALLIDRDALTVVMDYLRPESFYLPAHQVIYESMISLFEQTLPVDLHTVYEALKKSGELDLLESPHYLVDLTNKVASSANIEYHARIIVQKHIQRELIRVSTEVINKSFDETKDVFELLDEAETGLFNITQNNLNRSYAAIKELVVQARNQMEKLAEQDAENLGVPSGFTAMDRVTSGWQKSDLIIVAARPGMGKTSFTLALAKNAAMDHGQGVALFSLEMSSLQLTNKLLSMDASIPSNKIRDAKDLTDSDWTKLNRSIERLSEADIYIDDTPSINIFELRAKCRRLKMQHDVQLIIIDYLQLMSGGMDNKSGNREQEISKISRALKAMAKELDVPVIALSQLSRQVESRPDKRPQLSDLRESGAIEQDADMVIFLYRADYYDQAEPGEEEKTEVHIAKHRNGATANVPVRFIGPYTRFEEWEDTGFDGFNPGAMSSGSDSIITVASRMNDDEEDDTDAPF
ncbi:MAG: replicative DNA helicase [Bacteroidetes bacterium]|jgi:replicative DNA helicase|nr:replicative DNA helicase [Bacteroidota bacterium]